MRQAPGRLHVSGLTTRHHARDVRNIRFEPNRRVILLNRPTAGTRIVAPYEWLVGIVGLEDYGNTTRQIVQVMPDLLRWKRLIYDAMANLPKTAIGHHKTASEIVLCPY